MHRRIQGALALSLCPNWRMVGKENAFVRSLMLFIAIAYNAKSAGSVAKGLISLASGSGPLLGSIAFVLLEVCNLVYVAYGARQTWTRRFSPQRSADWHLGWSAGFAPAFSFTAHYSGALPGFILRTSFLPLHAFMCTIVATALPPAHALAHWAVASPAFVFLDFIQRCALHQAAAMAASGSCQQLSDSGGSGTILAASCNAMMRDSFSSSSSPPGLLVHLLTHGVFMTGIGLVAASVCSLLMTKYNEKQHGTEQARQEGVAIAYYAPHRAEFLPMETFGLDYGANGALRCMAALMRQLGPALTALAEHINESLVIAVACLPVGLYYLVHVAISKVAPELQSAAGIAPDELLIVMSAFFLLGRESCRVDLLPLMGHIRRRLNLSQEILSDALPSHVVSALLRDGQQRQDREENSSPEKPNAPPPHRRPVLSGSQGDEGAELGVAGSGAPRASGEGWFNMIARGVSGSGVRHVVPASPHQQRDVKAANQEAHSLHLGGGASPAVLAPAAATKGSSRRQASESSKPMLSRGASVDLVHSGSRGVMSDDVRPHRNSLVLLRNEKTAAAAAAAVSPSEQSFSSNQQVAARHECVTIFFSDICGFSSWAHSLPPEAVMRTLNDLYTRLDQVIVKEMPSLYKVETVGDAYIVAGNLFESDPQHAATMVQFALRARQEAAKVPRPDTDDGSTLQMRMGIHSGPITSGIVGLIRRRYTLFGDTMNMAARTESSCPRGCIQLTDTACRLCAPHLPPGIDVHCRGPVQVKGSVDPIVMHLISSAEDNDDNAYSMSEPISGDTVQDL